MSSKTKNETREQEKERESDKSTAREYFESICVAVILALFIRTFVFQAFKIPTGSMEENLLVGDHLIVNKMLYSQTSTGLEKALAPVREVRRGDVVVFKFPSDPERDFIKRVIGLPNERIEIKNKKVYIDGEPLDEPYTFFLEPPEQAALGVFADSRRDNMPEVRIPERHYFVMGDNRDNSHDSRFWGTLPAELLKGRALMIYWSDDAPEGIYTREGSLNKLVDMGKLIINFPKRTRWDRFFQLVR